MRRAWVAVAVLVLTGCGTPIADCGANHVLQNVCISCGAAGGCSAHADRCALKCTTQADCTTSGQTCTEGVCQLGGCI